MAKGSWVVESKGLNVENMVTKGRGEATVVFPMDNWEEMSVI